MLVECNWYIDVTRMTEVLTGTVSINPKNFNSNS